MTTTTERILALAAEHEEIAKGLRVAARELNGHQLGRKQEVFGEQLEAAIAIDHARRSGKPKATKTKKRTPIRTAEELKAIVTKILSAGRLSKAEFSKALTAHGVEPRGNIANLVRYRFITKNSHGYALVDQPRRAWGSRTRGRKKKQLTAKAKRSTTAKEKRSTKKGDFLKAAVYVLNQAKTPLSFADLRTRIAERDVSLAGAAGGFGSLIRYGYATQTAEGYVGTGKEIPA